MAALVAAASPPHLEHPRDHLDVRQLATRHRQATGATKTGPTVAAAVATPVDVGQQANKSIRVHSTLPICTREQTQV
ncbi:hypothetical protein VTK73DRAFT_8232 [Phialemonium thermophilum]|uniref:Secreted protein n=1 Tax=Phialemonium thermophilum TaxID=223376 RepID=A0ABR3W9N1_9PEZI